MLLNCLYKRTNFYKGQFTDAEKFLTLKQGQKFNIVNFGSNQPLFAFDYTRTELKGMNWAVSPSSFEYDFKILKQYHHHLKENAFVIIPVCPFNFFVMYGHKEKFENYKYYGFLKPGVIHNYPPWVRLTYRPCPVLSAGKTLIKIFLKSQDPAGQHSKLKLEINPMEDAEIERDAVEMIHRWLAAFSLSRIDDIKLSSVNKKHIEKNIEILNAMLAFCFDNGYKPVIMLLPVTNELYRLLPSSFIDEYVMNPINRANTRNASVLNYLHDKRFVPHKLYINSWWFNAEGRKFFTNTIIQELYDTYNR
jgi:hypothetical protein